MSISNIVFIGASDFGKASLEILVNADYRVEGVVTEVDDPCSDFSRSHSIPVLRLAEKESKVKDQTLTTFIDRRNPDILVMCVWEKKMPDQVVDSYKGRFINFHGSALPLYRGWAPINWQLIHGGTKIGMTVSLVANQFDRGGVLAQEYFSVDNKVNAGEVYDIMQPKAADMILRVVNKYSAEGKIRIREQPQRRIFPEAPKPNKDNTRIYWGDSAMQIHNLIRRWNPMAYAYTTSADIRLYISRSKVVKPRKKGIPGEIIWYGKNKFEVSCGKDNLEVLEVMDKAERKYDMPKLISLLNTHHPLVLGDNYLSIKNPGK